MPIGVRFGPVPLGARLVLTGIDEEGRLREQRFTGQEDTVLDWP